MAKKTTQRFLGWTRFKRLLDFEQDQHNQCKLLFCSVRRHAACVKSGMCSEPTVQGTYFEAQYLKKHGIKLSSDSYNNRQKLDKLRQQEFKTCRCIELLVQEEKP